MSPRVQSAESLYDRVSQEMCRVIIRRYSTSFSLASRLLDPPCRSHVENIYALVRFADEIVDGGAAAAGLAQSDAAQVLDSFERETDAAIASGYSINPIIHAFAKTARAVGFDQELTRPFFDSMRTDLSSTDFDQGRFDAYVYGSAEVVGLMCLRAFLQGVPITAAADARLVYGARRLGAAFQKVNFLRDLQADFESLGRSYFPGVSVNSFTELDKNRIVDDIDDDLRAAAVVIPELPAGSRRAVALAHGLFAELSARLRSTPAAELVSCRVRVPNPTKIRIAAGAFVGRSPRLVS